MISVRNLMKSFRDLVALENVTCDIEEASIYGVVGSNGAGKSTLFRLLAGVYRPDGGTILCDGEPVYENPVVKEHIVFVADEMYTLPGASLDRMAQLYGSVYDAFDWYRYEHLAHIYEIDRKARISSFSKGMRRQAAVVLALACCPKYLLLDETFDGMDAVKRQVTKAMLNEAVDNQGTAVLLASHSLRELEGTCDHLALLHQGKLVLDEDVGELHESYFKVQAVFREELDRSLLLGIEMVRVEQSGAVCNMIVHGDRDQVMQRLKRLDPMLLEIVPLNLEEVFICQMERLGYKAAIDWLN